jgi:hypothetical protein
MIQYKLQKGSFGDVVAVTIVGQNISIPLVEANKDYQAYLKWLDGYEFQMTSSAEYEWVKTSSGNAPLPADQGEQQ